MRVMTHALLLTVAVLGFTQPKPIVVHMIGDSTMADKPKPEVNPERGWGQALPQYFDHGVVVRNHAVNGRSTKSFIDEGKWAAVLAELKRGDYVFIQFGHNDEKVQDSSRYTSPCTAYRRNLERFVNESRAKGAIPVLFTPIVRRKFNEHGTLEDTHGVYALVVRDVARDLRVPFVDLEMLTEDLVRGAGPDASKQLYVYVDSGAIAAFPAPRHDDTHLSPHGASEVAKLAARALKTAVPALAPHILGVN
ncbi:MAG TPA: rhamnogalacturonan acetylesterase [Gemmatimonadaceae bacterium]|nr:rhamnogalacturonan acetylesterase [Gemmatimonadaceae bacterium]